MAAWSEPVNGRSELALGPLTFWWYPESSVVRIAAGAGLGHAESRADATAVVRAYLVGQAAMATAALNALDRMRVAVEKGENK